MAGTDLLSLMRDATPTLRRAMQEAAESGLAQGQGKISVALLFLALVECPTSDFSHILACYGVNRGDLIRQLKRGLTKGASVGSGISIPAARLAALIDASRRRNGAEGPLRSGMLLLAFLEEPRRFGPPDGLWPALARIMPEALWSDFTAATSGSAEQSEVAAPIEMASAGSVLDRFTTDLTAEARAGRIDPIHGRPGEIQQIVNILGRRRQNNPILVGEAGVGKTAVVEAFALKIAAGEVPPALRHARVLSLDLGLMQAGAGARGEFEARLSALVEAVETAETPTILFIDEAHALVGAGGAPGQGDAATLLKPALARGSLRMIAATTWAEYKRHFERDAALTRRFQLVCIDEPDEIAATAMLHALVGRLSAHHGVPILPEAVAAAVRLSQRHVSARRLPDKAIGILDAACSRIAQLRAEQPPASGAEAPVVDSCAVAAIIADLTGLPLATVLSEEAELLAILGDRLAQAVIGQDRAVALIARHVRTARAELGPNGRPGAALLLAGPDSVGKRRCAEALADILFGGSKGVLSLNMSEYQEAFSLSALRGAPRGYVGWGEGGLLTEAVRRNPHRVLLIENVERAHPSVQTLLSQMLETGTIEDSDGLVVDFRNTLVVMTTTISEDDAVGDPDSIRRRLAARLGGLAERAETVVFRPLTIEAFAILAARRLAEVAARLLAKHGGAMTWDADIPARLASAALPGAARHLEDVAAAALLSPLSLLLPRLRTGTAIHVTADHQGLMLRAGDDIERAGITNRSPPSQILPAISAPPQTTPRPKPQADPTRLWTAWR